jgi:hypothetical protein
MCLSLKKGNPCLEFIYGKQGTLVFTSKKTGTAKRSVTLWKVTQKLYRSRRFNITSNGHNGVD